MFSATMLPQVEDLARSILHDPIKIIIGQRYVVPMTRWCLPSCLPCLRTNTNPAIFSLAMYGDRNAATESIKQRLIFCGQEQGKLLAVRQLFQEVCIATHSSLSLSLSLSLSHNLSLTISLSLSLTVSLSGFR